MRLVAVKKIIVGMVIGSFSFLSIVPPAPVYAQGAVLPQPGSIVPLSPVFNPVSIKGIKIDLVNPLHMDFIIDEGDIQLDAESLRLEIDKLVKYFLASLTIPEEELWVNLSPQEPDRIITNSFSLTEMGRDLLAQDYILKQITASLIYPEGDLGKSFWKEIYENNDGLEKDVVKDLALNAFHKIWIIPQEAVVYENEDVAFVVKRRLKVMLEEDYKSSGSKVSGQGDSTDIIRQTILPVIEKEVNEGKNFANLRQIYDALILATWYKRNLKESFLGENYVGKNKIESFEINDKKEKERIYNQYLEALKLGVFNYIKEEYDPVKQTVIPRHYFSGGVEFAGQVQDAYKNTSSFAMDSVKKPVLARVDLDIAAADSAFIQDRVLGAMTSEDRVLYHQMKRFLSDVAQRRYGNNLNAFFTALENSRPAGDSILLSDIFSKRLASFGFPQEFLEDMERRILLIDINEDKLTKNLDDGKTSRLGGMIVEHNGKRKVLFSRDSAEKLVKFNSPSVLGDLIHELIEISILDHGGVDIEVAHERALKIREAYVKQEGPAAREQITALFDEIKSGKIIGAMTEEGTAVLEAPVVVPDVLPDSIVNLDKKKNGSTGEPPNNYAKDSKLGKEELEIYIAANPGLTMQKLADHFGVGIATMSRTIKKYGIDYKSKKAEKREFDVLAVQQYIEDNPDALMEDIANEFQTTVVNMRELIRENGIEYQSKKSKRPLSIAKEPLEAYIKEHPEADMDEIAAYFGKSRSSVSRAVRGHGIDYENKRDKLDPQALRKYIEENPDDTIFDMAEHFGVFFTTVNESIRRNRIPYESKRNRPREATSMLDEQELRSYISIHPDDSLERIGSHFGVTGGTVMRAIVLYEIPYVSKKRDSYTVNKDALRVYIEENPQENIREISEHFQISQTVILEMIKVFNIPYISKKAAYVDIDQEELRSYIEDRHPNHSLRDIAGAFKTSTGVIRDRINRWGINYKSKSHWSSEINQEDLRRYVADNPDDVLEEIADYFGASVKTIKNLIEEYGIPYVYKTAKIDMGKEVLQEYINDHPQATLKMIADAFKVSTRTIVARMDEYGISYENKNSGVAVQISEAELRQYIDMNPKATLYKIGAHFGVSANVIRRRMSLFEIAYVPKTIKGSTIDEQALRQYIEENPYASKQRIADHFGVVIETLNRALSYYGIRYERKEQPVFSIQNYFNEEQHLTADEEVALIPLIRQGEELELKRVVEMYIWIAVEILKKRGIDRLGRDRYDEMLSDSVLKMYDIVREYADGFLTDGLENYIRQSLTDYFDSLEKEQKAEYAVQRRSVRLDQPIKSGDDSGRRGDLFEDPNSVDPTKRAEIFEVIDARLNGQAGLINDTQKEILVMHFVQGYDFTVISNIVGISESEVSVLYDQAIDVLQQAEVVDRAELNETVGGIDLNPSKIDLKTQGAGVVFEMPSIDNFNPQTFIGVVPIIQDVTPIINLPLFLGARDDSGIVEVSLK